MQIPIFSEIEFPKRPDRSEFINSKIFSDLSKEGVFVTPIDRRALINSERLYKDTISNIDRLFVDTCNQLTGEASQSMEYGTQTGNLDSVTKSVFKLTRNQYPVFYSYLESSFRQFLSRLYIDDKDLKILMNQLISQLKKSTVEFEGINRAYRKTGRLKDDISLLLTDGRQKYSAMIAKSKKERLWINPEPFQRVGLTIVPNKHIPTDLTDEFYRLYINYIWRSFDDDIFLHDEELMIDNYAYYGE